MINGRREKGVVLRDPNFKYRTYDLVAQAGLQLEEFIARFDRMLRVGQHLDHMKFIASQVKRPNPADEHSVDALEEAAQKFEDLLVQARNGGAGALRGAGATTAGAEAADGLVRANPQDLGSS